MSDLCTWIGIGIDIPKQSSLYDECIRINSLLNKIYGNVAVFSQENRPHLNLYDLSVPQEKLGEIKKLLQTVVSKLPPFHVDISTIDRFHFGLFFLDVDSSQELFRLHKEIVEVISPLRGKCVCKDYLQPHRKYTTEQKQMLTLHGNPHVLSQFRPHISIGFIPDSKESDLSLIRKEVAKIIKTKDFIANRIELVVENLVNNKNEINQVYPFHVS